MDSFPKITASAKSLAKRKLVYGIGINDSSYITHLTINNERVRCPYYMKWSCMIMRCYGKSFLLNNPTYIGCTVCDEWLAFSNFRKWMVKQDWQGKELDKDIISQGNKEYSPAACRFISHELNSLLTARGAARGLYPMGVSWHKKNERYQACIRINGKTKGLGSFKTPQEAKAAYDKEKYAEIHRHAMLQTDPLVRDCLLNWVVE